MKTRTFLTIALAAALAMPANTQTAEGYQVTKLFEFTDVEVPEPKWNPDFSANNMRGLAVSGNDLYVPTRGLVSGGNGVARLDATTGAFVSVLDNTGMEGGTFAVNDIAVSDDGVIYVCNMTSDARSKKWDKASETWVDMAGTAPFKVYRYATPESTPEVFLSFNANEHASTEGTAKTNAFRMGDGFTFHGTSRAGTFITGIDNLRERCYEWTITDGVLDPNPAVLAFHNPYAAEDVEKLNEVTLDPRFGGYGRFYKGFDEDTYIERSKAAGTQLRVFKYSRTGDNGWNHYPQEQAVTLNEMRFGSGNAAQPFEFGGKRYIAMVDFDMEQDGLANAQAVIYDVTDWNHAVELFRSSEIYGGYYKNGTAAVAVRLNDDGFNAYFLCANGLCGYSFAQGNTSTDVAAARESAWQVWTDAASHTVSFPDEAAAVRVWQAQTGVEVQRAAGVQCVQLPAEGVYILQFTLADGTVLNRKVIL